MWFNVRGHDEIADQFRRALARGRLASTFLFVGPAGIGKRTFALALAKCLLCQRAAVEQLTACEQCESCRMLDAETHPDLHQVGLPAGRSSIPLELLLGDDQHRRQEGLCHEIGLKPFMGGRRVAIINDADSLNREGANCLLKTLEEPPPRSVLILISASLDKQLPTIRSRSQLIRFTKLDPSDVETILLEQKLVDDPTEAARLAQLSSGSVATALELADPTLWEFREKFLSALTQRPLKNVPLARQVAEFVDAAGKEASLRRTRLRWLMGTTAEFYRDLARGLCAATLAGDPGVQQAARTALAHPGWELDNVLRVADQALDATSFVDRNANQALVIEAWLDELSRTLTPAK